jgi:dihydrofolate reductase
MRKVPGSLRIVGYAIISLDGMIADADGRMGETLVIEADQLFYREALSRAALVVHGRNSAEPGSETSARRRVIVTTRVAALSPAAASPLAVQWNPLGMPFADVVAALGIAEGEVAVVGGTDVFELFLAIGYDSFHLSRSSRGSLPGGRPLFRGVPRRSPEAVLAAAGLRLRREERLAADLSLASWERATPITGMG